MSDIIHCNVCYRMPEPRAQFYINNCGHIACYACCKAGKMTPICPLCKHKTQMRLIAPGMRGISMFENPMKAVDHLIQKVENVVKNIRTRESTPYPRNETSMSNLPRRSQ